MFEEDGLVVDEPEEQGVLLDMGLALEQAPGGDMQGHWQLLAGCLHCEVGGGVTLSEVVFSNG